MKKFSTLSFCLVAALSLGLANSHALAQDEEDDPLRVAKGPSRIYVGPVVGFNRTMHTSEFQAIPSQVAGVTTLPCPVIEGGTASGYFFGLTGEYLLGDPKDSKSSIIARVVYSTLPASFRSINPDLYPTRVDGAPDGFLNSQTENFSEVSYQTIDLEAMYKLNFWDRLGVAIGPTIGMVMKFEQRQEYNLIEPLNAQFIPNQDLVDQKLISYANNNRTIVIREGEVPGKSAIRLGLKAGLQYEIPVRRLMFVPGIYYNLGLTQATSNENWRVNAIQPQLDIRYVF